MFADSRYANWLGECGKWLCGDIVTTFCWLQAHQNKTGHDSLSAYVVYCGVPGAR